MFTAVVERRREIGLRRVVGATRGQVIGQLVTEAALVGAFGSVLGTVAGAIGASAMNVVTERMGAPIFLVSGRLVAVALIAPTLLAAIAGLWPAWRASRLSPTEAVRYA
jgi:putative ABC transport system permease protein